jgi:hypothetical protein
MFICLIQFFGSDQYTARAKVEPDSASRKRSDRLSPHVFRGRYARVTVADTAKDFKQSPISTDSAYSVIRRIVRWETGGGE